MKLINRLFCLTWFGFLLVVAQPSRATVELIGQSYVSASMGLANGSPLVAGVVEIGFYSIAPTRSVFENYTQASSFLTNFTSLGSASMGIDTYLSLFTVNRQIPHVETGGVFDDLASNVYKDKQIYLLIGNASTISSSSQIGVFTKLDWLIPANTDSPTATMKVFEISDVTLDGILFGSYAANEGAYPSDGVLNEYRLAVIPEPSSMSLMVMGLASVLAFRRKALAKREKCV